MSALDDVSGWEIAVMILLMFPLALFTGWALSLMWAWFVVPLGAPSLSAPHAAGLAILLKLVTPKSKGDSKGPWETLAINVFVVLGTLGIGALLHAMMT